ncbi:hypothetical protein FH972_012830 [Carpinus fangiana]|uniref:Uncharacterized protein n=1 Tax=Carpinus fangiana TaxID=176857 RepID=A0A5N6R8C2_9ROSI|nr:hypothetical protein FH972_012830 [Carpinus fangiana]
MAERAEGIISGNMNQELENPMILTASSKHVDANNMKKKLEDECGIVSDLTGFDNLRAIRKISGDDETLTNKWSKKKRRTRVKVDQHNYGTATFYDQKDRGGATWRMSVLEAYDKKANPPRRRPGFDLNWCIIEVCKLSTKKGDSLTFNLSPRVVVRSRTSRGGDSDRTPRRRSSGRTDHEVPLDPEVRTETSEPLMQHDAAVQDSSLPSQRRNPRRRGREVMNVNNSHPAQVSSLPNQRRNRRQRNMNGPINNSTIIVAQSTAQLEIQPQVNNYAEREQLRDDSPDPEPYHVQDNPPEIQTNAEEDSLQREGPTQINTQVLDHEINFNAENTGAIISPHREGSVERNTQFDQFRHADQPSFESEIGTNVQPIHAEDAPPRERPVETNAQLVHENNFIAENIGANLGPEIQTNAENIAQEDSQQREWPVETNAHLVHKNNLNAENTEPVEINALLVHENNFNAENIGANPEPEIQTNAENIAQEDSQQREGPVETNAQLVHENNFNAENTRANPEHEIQTNAENIIEEDFHQREGPIETNAQPAKLISGDRTMAPEGRVNRAALDMAHTTKILMQIISGNYKERETGDWKVFADEMCNTFVKAMIDVIALYLDYEKGKEVSTETRKILWNGCDVDPISSFRVVIPGEYMEGETSGCCTTLAQKMFDTVVKATLDGITFYADFKKSIPKDSSKKPGNSKITEHATSEKDKRSVAGSFQ